MGTNFNWDKNSIKIFFATLGEIAGMIFSLFEIFKKESKNDNKVVEEKKGY